MNSLFVSKVKLKDLKAEDSTSDVYGVCMHGLFTIVSIVKLVDIMLVEVRMGPNLRYSGRKRFFNRVLFVLEHILLLMKFKVYEILDNRDLSPSLMLELTYKF